MFRAEECVVVGFVQTIAIETADPDAVRQLLEDWHRTELGVAPGYVSYRLLADRNQPNRYLIVVDFTSAEEAARNNDRPETAAWAESLGERTTQSPKFVGYDVTATSA